MEGLPAIYAHRSTDDLKVIYGYLETMHYNDRDDDDEHYDVGMLNRWGDAREKLLAHLGYPKWKWLDCEGYGYTDSPILATEDMNYVSGSQSSYAETRQSEPCHTPLLWKFPTPQPPLVQTTSAVDHHNF